MARTLTSPMHKSRKVSLARLLCGISCGAASLALATAPSQVRAQAVQGTATVQFGASAPVFNGTNTDTIFVSANEALIDWAINSPTGEFLPEGMTLRFNADTGTPFTVLNRVTDTATTGPLSISGTVSSDPLGRIWFYNAGGWVVGSKGVFNVGSLILTSLPITVDPATSGGTRLYGDKNEIRFGSALDPKSSVSIQSGAQINATLFNSSYVALVAPRVDQAGTIKVNGSAAFVAAEAATLTINNGLFDIVVDSGSADDTGVSHTGSTTWAANSSSTDSNHGVYLIAVPKNQAMTAIVSGRMGYDSATTAAVVDGSVVLSAGYNVASGRVDPNAVVGDDASLAISNLTIGSKGFATSLLGSASGGIAIDATTASTVVNGSAAFDARGDLSATIDNDRSISVEGDLSLTSANGAKAGNVAVSVAGDGGLFVSGGLSLASTATGAIQTDPSNGDALLPDSLGDDALAGNVSLTVTNGSVFATSTSLLSDATSGLGALSTGSATSGSAKIVVSAPAGSTSNSVSFGDLTISSAASHGFFSRQQPVSGGNATSGEVSLSVSGGTYSSRSLSLYSDAITYSVSDQSPLDATAGAVSVSFSDIPTRFQTGSIYVSNYASASDGGVVSLGNVSLSLDNANAGTSLVTNNGTLLGPVSLGSSAYGDLINPNTVSLNLTNNSQLDTLDASVYLAASGSYASGTQRSANVSFVSDASTLNAGYLSLSSDASSYESGVDSQSGAVTAILRNGSSVTSSSGTYLRSQAIGGSGFDGGSGTGGAVGFTLSDSSYSGDLSLRSTGSAGRRGDIAGLSGVGTGGDVSFTQSGKTASFTGSQVTVSSLGQGGAAFESARTGLGSQVGDGASGIGGTATFTITDGTFAASTLVVSATGEGGNGQNAAGGVPGAGGLGLGGSAALNVTGGLVSVPDITVTASGYGGDGAFADFDIDGGVGGAGTGGEASATITSGTIRTDSLLVEANGNTPISDPIFGGISYFGNGGYEFGGTLQPGRGGLGTGGVALVTIDGGSLSATVPSRDVPLQVQVRATGSGGLGGYSYGSGTPQYSGSGGDGVGGTATLRYLSGVFDAGIIGVDATGSGGRAGNFINDAEDAFFGGSGGSGTGGTATFEIAADFGASTSLGDLRTVTVSADGIGAISETGTNGGTGGNGTGGTGRLLVAAGTTALGDLTITAEGRGSDGGDGKSGGNGGRGGAGIGGVVEVVSDGLGAKLTITGAALSAAGVGGNGGNGGADTATAGNGGAGGLAIGGEVAFAAANLGTLTVSGPAIEASGRAGNGGLGGNSALVGGVAQGNGGNGADGSGGAITATASGGGSLAFDGLALIASGLGGAGGGRVDGSSSGTPGPSIGGTGGRGSGGLIALNSTGANSSISFGSLTATVDGTGGAGADGAGSTASGDGTAGSAGGDGFGGAFSLLADLGGSITIAEADGGLAIATSGFGGNGGRGVDATGSSGGSGGNGGAAGAGSGGTIALSANGLGEASLGLFGGTTLTASGVGGRGGAGGNGASASETGVAGGNGGNTGLAQSGVGGAISIRAEGGKLGFGDLAASAVGTTQFRNLAGLGGNGPGGAGIRGTSTTVASAGGRIAFSASDDIHGGLGQVTARAVIADVTSKQLFVDLGFGFNTIPGSISLSNSATAAGGGLHFGSFRGEASGFPANLDPTIGISVTAGAIAVDADLTLASGGNIAITLSDGASLTADTARVLSDTGIAVSGEGDGRFSARTINLLSFGSIGIVSNGCATAVCRPVEASGSLGLEASGDFSLSGPAELAGLGNLEVYAGGNITGDAGSGYYSDGNVAVRAGNDATIRNISGANVIAEAGAVLDGDYFYVDGLLTLGEASGGGRFDASGSLDLNSGGTVLTLDGTAFTAGAGIGVRSGNDIRIGGNNSFLANTGPSSVPERVIFAAGGQRIEYSLVPSNIATLSIGAGSAIDAGTGGVEISGAAIDARLASFAGASFRADVTGAISASSIRRTDGDALDADCLEGAICIGDVNSADFVSIGDGDFKAFDIRSNGAISGKSVVLYATSDITIGGPEVSAQITAVDGLSITSEEGGIAVLGGSSLQGGFISLTAAANLSGTGNIEATVSDIGLSIGGDIDAASLVAARELTSAVAVGGETEESFAAAGALRTGILSLGATSAVSAAAEIRIGSLSLAGFDGTFDAATSLHVGTASDVGNLSLTGGTAVTFGDLVVDGDLSIDAPSIEGTSASAGGLLSITGDDLVADQLESAGDLSITIVNEAILGFVTSTGGSVFIDPALLTFDAITADGGITLAGGTITGGTLDAGAGITVTATGALTLASATSGTTMTLGADSLQAGALDAGTTIGIATNGRVSLTDVRAGGAISIGAEDLGALSLTGDGNLSLTISNSADLGTVTVLGTFNLSAASLTLGTSRSGRDSVLAISGNAQIGSIFAGLADTGQNLVQVVVQALGNSYTGGQLLPVFDVVQGQTFTVSSSTNDLWSAGALPRFSDADGLIAFRLATAQDDSGVQPGTQIGGAFGSLTIGNFTAPFGALVGEVAGQRVLVGANGTITAPATGTLSVGYWDSNAGDNTGSIAFNFGLGAGGGGTAMNPASVTVTAGSNLTIGTAQATSAITLDAGGGLQLGGADAGTALSLVGTTIDAGTLKAGTDITIASTGASVIDTATAGRLFTAATGTLDFNLVDAASDVQIRSLTGTQGGDLISGANITIDGDGKIVLGHATAADTVTIATGDALSYGSVEGGSVIIGAASASGGAITARAGNLRIDVSGNLTTGQLVASESIDLTARDVTLASAQSGADFSANVRSLSAQVLGASGSLTLAGSGTVEVGTATAGTGLEVTSRSLTFIRMSSGGALDVFTDGNVAGGDLVATGQIRIATGTGSFTYGSIEGGGIAIGGQTVSGGALTARTQDLAIAVSGDASLGTIDAAGDVDIEARNLGFSTIKAGGAFRSANTAMTGTSIAAGRDIDLSTEGDLALSALSGASARISSRGIVNVSGLQLTGAISVQADAVALASVGNLQIVRILADAGNVDLSASGSIRGGTIEAVGDIALLASNGDVVISHLSAGYADAVGGSLRALGTVTSGAVGQGNIDIVASGDIVINDVADAAKAFTMNAGNTIRLNGLATGATMDLTSADLEIGASGRLGETAHTDAITLRNTGQGALRLGDNIASTVSGYAISQAEFSRIRSRGNLTIRGTQQMLVGDLAVVAQAGTVQGQIGETGTLSLRSNGLISFFGALSISNAAGNTLSVSSSADGIYLDATTGSIRLLEGETRGGSLLLSGSGIAMVTRSALEDIAQLTDTALITDRLGLNDGVSDGRTLVEADAITLRSDEQVYVQNTSLGTRLDDRRGLVANSLTIGSRDGGQLDIVINGIVNGQTGVDAIEQISFDESFTDLSSVNGCVIVNANTCNKLPFEIIELRDLVEEVLKTDPEDSALQVTDSFTKTTLIQLNQIAPAGFEPLIDEPVTGTGNDDLLGAARETGE